jgi:hypothetical protein
LSITRRPVTASITANDKYYDGTNIATLAGCTLTGVVNGDAVTCGGTATFASIHAGNWLVTANITLSGAAAGNYYLVSSAPTTRANINPRPITVTADAKNKFYGEADPPLTYQVTSGSLVAGDSFTGGLTRVPGENLGSYAILQGTLTAGSNYAVSYVGALLTIKVRPITFTVTGSMGAARSFHTATLILKDGPNKGKVLVSGGLDSKGAPLASAELYDPITRTFSVTGNNLPNKAAGHTATTLPNGNILVVGGGNSSSEIYDPTTNVWSSAGGISGPRTHHTAVLLNTGKVLITGGSDSSGKTIATSLLYDPAAGAYSNTGSLSVSREFHTATLLPNGKVLVAGGRSRNGNGYTHLSNAELYDPATGSFTAVASPMSSARHGHRAIESNGKILLVGGANSTTVAAADWYDPVSGTFTAAASLNTPRQNFTATVFAGAVVVAGGVNGSTRLLTAEQYVGTFLLAGDTMTTARAAHTATLLNGGSAVLITGGQGNGGTSVATAELLTVK